MIQSAEGEKFPKEELVRLSRQLFRLIWEKSRKGEPFEGEEELLARILLDHPEHAEAWERGEHFEEKGDMNPFLHAQFHLMVEGQLAAGNPPETAAAVDRLVKEGLTRHEAIHRIVELLCGEVYESLRAGRSFDREGFIERLKGLSGSG